MRIWLSMFSWYVLGKFIRFLVIRLPILLQLSAGSNSYKRWFSSCSSINSNELSFRCCSQLRFNDQTKDWPMYLLPNSLGDDVLLKLPIRWTVFIFAFFQCSLLLQRMLLVKNIKIETLKKRLTPNWGSRYCQFLVKKRSFFF